MTAGKEEGSVSSNPGPRKLGRGLGALLSVPIRVPGSPAVTPPSPGANQSIPSLSPAQPTGGFQSASITASSEASTVPRGTPAGQQFVSLSVAEVSPNLRQPRRDFDETSIQALAESIRTAGLMQPIVVRPGSKGVSTRFELIAGERRWRAAKLLGLAEIPAVVREIGDQTAAEWALIENIQREDLNPIERSEAIGRLVEEFALTHQQLAERLGLDRVTITNLLRLADLDPFTKDAVRKGVLSQGHAKVLLGVLQADRRKALASAAISGGLSVRELERRVREMDTLKQPSLSGPPALPSPKPHIDDLQRRLSEHLGTKIAIREDPKKKGSGQVIIDYYSIDQFEGLMAKMGFRNEL
jgi:ParB family chromosome partitioning protein